MLFKIISYITMHILYVEYETDIDEKLTYVNKPREHDAILHEILVTIHKQETKINQLEARDKQHEARIQELEVQIQHYQARIHELEEQNQRDEGRIILLD